MSCPPISRAASALRRSVRHQMGICMGERRGPQTFWLSTAQRDTSWIKRDVFGGERLQSGMWRPTRVDGLARGVDLDEFACVVRRRGWGLAFLDRVIDDEHHFRRDARCRRVNQHRALLELVAVLLQHDR